FGCGPMPGPVKLGGAAADAAVAPSEPSTPTMARLRRPATKRREPCDLMFRFPPGWIRIPYVIRRNVIAPEHPAKAGQHRPADPGSVRAVGATGGRTGEHVCAGARRGPRRVVLRPGRPKAPRRRARGVGPDPHRPRRALAPAVARRRPRAAR